MASPTDYKDSKPTDSQKANQKKKEKNNTEQITKYEPQITKSRITKLEITNTNLKTKTSTEQHLTP